MTNDKELVEVWRGEFIDLVCLDVGGINSDSALFFRSGDGEFENHAMYLKFGGFLMAKRSQPIVKIDSLSRYGSTDDILARITAAGIKYTIGE